MRCQICDTPALVTDHCHRYVNRHNEVKLNWWVDNRSFRTPRSLESYLKDTYGFNTTQVINFIRDIPVKTN